MSIPQPMAPVVADRPRLRIGKSPTPGDREIVYRCDDALEIDAIDGYQVETKRVFFSDVQMITWHQRYSVLGLWIAGVSMAFGLLFWALIGTTNEVGFWIGFWFLFVPNIPLTLWFLWPYWHVTVFGRRGAARMRWHFRKAHSLEVFEQLTRDIRAYQQAHTEPGEPVEAALPGFLPPDLAVSDQRAAEITPAEVVPSSVRPTAPSLGD